MFYNYRKVEFCGGRVKKTDVLDFYGGKQSACAKALGITCAAVGKWGEVIPERRAARLHVLTRGKLKYSPKDYDKSKKPEA